MQPSDGIDYWYTFRNLPGGVGGYGDDGGGAGYCAEGGNACHLDLPEVCNKSKRDISQSSLRMTNDS